MEGKIEIKHIQDEIRRLVENYQKAFREKDPSVSSFRAGLYPSEVEFDYLNEMLNELFSKGIVQMPTSEEEFKSCTFDIFRHVVVNAYQETFIKRGRHTDYYSSPLEIFLEKIHEGKLPPVKDIRTFDIDYKKISKQPWESVKEDIKKIWPGTTKIKDMPYGIKESYWINSGVDIRLHLPTESTDLQGIENKMEEVLNLINQPHSKMQNVIVTFDKKSLAADETRYILSPDALLSIAKLDELIDKKGGSLYFSEYQNSTNTEHMWNLKELIRANQEVDKLVQTIKENKLSPFEAACFVCAWAKENLAYNDKTESREISNTALSALITHGVRCVGFAEFVNTILNLSGFEKDFNCDDALHAKKIACTIEKDKDGLILPDHCQSLIKIKDSKYGLDGEYICDVNTVETYKCISDLLKENSTECTAIDPAILSNLYLTNLRQVRKMSPDYTVFPYSTDTDISTETREIEDKYSNWPESKTRKVVSTVDGVPSDLYYRKSSNIMIDLAENQGRAIPNEAYLQAYAKILPILHPDLEKEELKSSLAASIALNMVIDDFQKNLNAQGHGI